MSYAENFKRFSVSAGWLHVMPQGNGNAFNINTAVAKGTRAKVGDISPQAFIAAIDPQAKTPDGDPMKPALTSLLATPLVVDTLKKEGLIDQNNNLTAQGTGSATVNGIDAWTERGTGLEAKKFDTLGLMLSYYVNDHVSLQLIGGIPPKVDIKGQGVIIAPMTGRAYPSNDLLTASTGESVALKKDIPITNLGNKPTLSTARAWTPAIEVQYQFGKTGVNKFRPYIGAGIMYAHFNQIKLNGQTQNDLIAAGHMVKNILDGKSGAALDGKKSSANPQVRVDAKDDFAPIVTLGFSYDFNENWYGVASVSYAKLSNQVKIDVLDSKNANQALIRSTTKIEIDPIITYLGVGYRF
ncbi:outer membrane protein [Acinetobacter calcoaceticus]|uniref:Outer membrane protein n=1 Tax=Acinetobacter calcoaceticus TaxID=471 RepID=A0A4R1XBA5_ACICA|nr:outer membrane protein [Acinetobacter calcoaceticus]